MLIVLKSYEIRNAPDHIFRFSQTYFSDIKPAKKKKNRPLRSGPNVKYSRILFLKWPLINCCSNRYLRLSGGVLYETISAG